MDAPTLEIAPFYRDVANAPEGGQCHWTTTSDGLRIRVAHWAKGVKGTVLLFNGRTEYVEKYGPAAGEFAARGYGMITADWRGQGLADRMIEDPNPGHVAKFSDYQKDVAAFLGMANRLNLPRPYYLVAHSMGGAIALRALHDGMKVNAAVFSAPMWGISMAPALRPLAWSLSWASRSIGLGQNLTPGTKRESYLNAVAFEDNMLTTDREMWEWMRTQVSKHPELVLGGPSLRWLYEALNDTRHLSRLPTPTVPTLTTLGSDEQIVDPDRIKALMADWKNGTLDIIRGAKHEVMMDNPSQRQYFFDAACALFDGHP
ncbi:alpha/beta fold hydrolase [Oceaniglobus ichthyenteri]|uniref:alpha/beta fold hydrolase n=1 Tax=Oceaniglobus ichthyenteri TaxID=2136177 RepID=UPI000D39DEB9|nr:alpha/beta hydrolase [Oceaniglobus ichthyenteri]